MIFGTKNNKDYGFFSNSDEKNLLSIYKLSDEEYKNLLNKQASGKCISHDINGKPILVDIEDILTSEEKNKMYINKVQEEINKRLSKINTIENQAKAFIDEDFSKRMKDALKKVLSVKEQKEYPSSVDWADIPESI